MFYAIRHGQTNYNISGILQGDSINEPLNEEGIRQAREAAEKIKFFNISEIYSSDLLRARQTAEEINKKLNLNITFSPLLRETNYGEAEGKELKELKKIPFYLNICTRFDAGDNDICFPGGESRRKASDRFLKFLKTIHTQKNVLIVSHGGILRSFSTLNGGPDEKIPNCGGICFSTDEAGSPAAIHSLFK